MDKEMIQEDGAAIEAAEEKRIVDKICVGRYADGTYSVYLEPVGGAPAESPAGAVTEDAHECEDMEQALLKVVKLDRDNPVEAGTEDADMMAGAAEEGYEPPTE